MSPTETTIELIDSLSEQFRGIDTLPQFDQAVVAFVSRQLNADLSLVVKKENDHIEISASIPADWTDSDDLLTPVSLPAHAITEGKSCVVDDRSDVRCATTPESRMDSTKVAYRSMMVTPFEDGSALVVGSQTPGAFTESDLERLRILRAFATAMRSQIERADIDSQEKTMEAAADVLSHDAGNFLCIIQGHLELAREDPTEAHFDAIERGTQRLEELIDTTSTILRTGEQVTDVGQVDLNDVTQTAWEAVETKQATLVTGDLGRIEADRSSLCEVLENVFRNAVEHAGPDVTVWASLLAEADGFYIEDSGPGHETDELDSVFEAGASTQEDNQGLGLAIVKRIAESHGWEVSVGTGDMGGFRIEFTNVKCSE